MLDNFQIINEKGKPKFAIIDYTEFQNARTLLNNSDKLEDYLDLEHIKKVKKRKEKTYSLDEVKKELDLTY
ncbi:MAG: prevent-host-death family protein [Candidatus Kapabacteria bacterium]|nr:prevent-host-death family protein [Candidatus Kapabacteria bacterium]